MSRANQNFSDGSPSAPGAVRMNLLWLIVAWSFVGLPAAWGISQTARQAVALFRNPPAATPVQSQSVAPVTPAEHR